MGTLEQGIHNGRHQLQYQAGIRPSAGLVYFYILISYQDSQPPPPCVQPAITTIPLFFLFSPSDYSNSLPPMFPSSDFSNLSREYVPHCNLLQLEAALDIYDKWTNIAKGTTDPRVEYISQVLTQILIKFQVQNLD